MSIHKYFTYASPKSIPLDIEELDYSGKDYVDFSLLTNLHTLSLSDKYKYSLDNLPITVHTLKFISLNEPLTNIPSTIKQIYVKIIPNKEILLESKIPFDCQILCGRKYFLY